MTWQSWDGTVWDLTDPAGGLFVTNEGLRGLSFPLVQRYTSSAPTVAGTTWRGFRTDERETFWPVYLFHDAGSEAWMEFDRAFWRSMHPAKTGLWTVYHPNGTTRAVELRFGDDGDHAFTHDPVKSGWEKYGVRCYAEQPYWMGPLVETETFYAADPVEVFGGPGVLNLMAGSDMSTASITNPGDVESWPVWRITGPFTSLSVGVGDAVVELPGGLGAGESRIIHTRPDLMVMLDGSGADVTDELGGSTEFVPVPAGQDESLTIEMSGGASGASVQAGLQPLYFRAW